MPRGNPGASLRFVFDQHTSGPALRQLRNQGVAIRHVAEVGLSEADDAQIFRWAVQEWRIVVTRNYCDFAPLVDAYARQGIAFPGVLFYGTSVRHNDVGHHVRTLLEWIEAAAQSRTNLVENSSGWLR